VRLHRKNQRAPACQSGLECNSYRHERDREGDGIALDGNTAFPLNVHIIQDLVFKIPIVDNMGLLDKSVRQG